MPGAVLVLTCSWHLNGVMTASSASSSRAVITSFFVVVMAVSKLMKVCSLALLARAQPALTLRYHHCRSWEAKENFVTYDDFAALLNSPPYNVMLSCESWRPISRMVFPSSLRYGNKAVQAVEVVAKSTSPEQHLRPYKFTFCLEMVEQGPYKGCWLTYGVRVGDYASV